LVLLRHNVDAQNDVGLGISDNYDIDRQRYVNCWTLTSNLVSPHCMGVCWDNICKSVKSVPYSVMVDSVPEICEP